MTEGVPDKPTTEQLLAKLFGLSLDLMSESSALMKAIVAIVEDKILSEKTRTAAVAPTLPSSTRRHHFKVQDLLRSLQGILDRGE
jgi:hypothetical protein